MEDPDNREFHECENEDLHCWVEQTGIVCLPCAVALGVLTEDEIEAFSPVAWRHYQRLTNNQTGE